MGTFRFNRAGAHALDFEICSMIVFFLFIFFAESFQYLGFLLFYL